MRRSKKLIIAAVLAAVMLAGSIGGVILATDNGDDSKPDAKYETLLNRISEIYQENTGVAIDQEALKDAFAQARSEMQIEAVENYLQSLVEQGKITQDEADQYQTWWQSRPDTQLLRPYKGGFGFRGFRSGMKWGGGHTGWGGHTASDNTSNS